MIGGGRRSGFTAVELIVVISIILLLSGLIVGVGALAKQRAHEARAVRDLEVMKNALEEYRLEYQQYPERDFGYFTNALALHMPDGFDYLDPWGTYYQYEYDPTKSKYSYALYSKGPDKAHSTDSADSPENADDIYSEK